MNFKKAFQIASFALVSTLAAGNFLSKCGKEKAISLPEPIRQLSSLEQTMQDLNAYNPNYKLEGNDLVALTRMLYFEDAGDRKLDDQKKGYAAVAEVIKNRLLFDTCDSNSPVKNPTCGEEKVTKLFDGDKGLAAIINKYVKKNGRKIYQFTSQVDFAEYFKVDSLSKGMNYLIPKKFKGKVVKDEEGKTVYTNVFDEEQINLAYTTLIDVLEGKISSSTMGALYYKNNDNSPNVWHDKEAMKVSSNDCLDLRYKLDKKAQDEVDASRKKGKIDCRVEQGYLHDYTRGIGSHSFYTLDEGGRREVIWDNLNRNTYVNGKCTNGPCLKQARR